MDARKFFIANGLTCLAALAAAALNTWAASKLFDGMKQCAAVNATMQFEKKDPQP